MSSRKKSVKKTPSARQTSPKKQSAKKTQPSRKQSVKRTSPAKQKSASLTSVIKQEARDFNSNVKSQIKKEISSAKKNVLSKIKVSKTAINKFIDNEKQSAKKIYTEVKNYTMSEVKKNIGIFIGALTPIIIAYIKYKFDVRKNLMNVYNSYKAVEEQFKRLNNLIDEMKTSEQRREVAKHVNDFEKVEKQFHKTSQKIFGQGYVQVLKEQKGVSYQKALFMQMLDKKFEEGRARVEDEEQVRRERIANQKQTAEIVAKTREKQKILERWFDSDTIAGFFTLNQDTIKKMVKHLDELDSEYNKLVSQTTKLQQNLENDDVKVSNQCVTQGGVTYEPLELLWKEKISKYMSNLDTANELDKEYARVIKTFRQLPISNFKRALYTNKMKPIQAQLSLLIKSTENLAQSYAQQYNSVVRLLQMYIDSMYYDWPQDKFKHRSEALIQGSVARLNRDGHANGKVYILQVPDFFDRVQNGYGDNSDMSKDMPCVVAAFRKNYAIAVKKHTEKKLAEIAVGAQPNKLSKDMTKKIENVQKKSFRPQRLVPIAVRRTAARMKNFLFGK